jgi:hypothetical protein
MHSSSKPKSTQDTGIASGSAGFPPAKKPKKRARIYSQKKTSPVLSSPANNLSVWRVPGGRSGKTCRRTVLLPGFNRIPRSNFALTPRSAIPESRRHPSMQVHSHSSDERACQCSRANRQAPRIITCLGVVIDCLHDGKIAPCTPRQLLLPKLRRVHHADMKSCQRRHHPVGEQTQAFERHILRHAAEMKSP